MGVGQGVVKEKKEGNDIEVELEDGTVEVVSRYVVFAFLCSIGLH